MRRYTPDWAKRWFHRWEVADSFISFWNVSPEIIKKPLLALASKVLGLIVTLGLSALGGFLLYLGKSPIDATTGIAVGLIAGGAIGTILLLGMTALSQHGRSKGLPEPLSPPKSLEDIVLGPEDPGFIADVGPAATPQQPSGDVPEASPAHVGQRHQGEKDNLIFLAPEIEEGSTSRKAVEVVASVRSERSTDAIQCRLRIDSVLSSTGRERRFHDVPLMWTTGRKEETITPKTTRRFLIARSHFRRMWIRRVTELVFGGGRTEILKLRGGRPGGIFWLSVQLSYSNSRPVYGVYRLNSINLHDFVDAEDISKSDVVQFIDQYEERPNLEKLIAESPLPRPANESGHQTSADQPEPTLSRRPEK